MERQEGIKVPHGLTFPLAVVEAIGRPHGLVMSAEESTPEGPLGFDAIFLSVLDSRCMLEAAKHFARWRVPFRSRDRGFNWPVVVAGGQGLHNPLPLAPVADVIVIGDGEDPLPLILDAYYSYGWTRAFLTACAGIRGVFVPSLHDRREITIEQSVSSDIGITLREDIRVNHDGTRRLEIARGCKYKCAFCSLGWRTPVRENTPEQIITEIRKSPRRLHLQAGDAESHSGIAEIRTALRAHGGSDSGWTGRLDTLLENPDQTIPGQKRYAFGVEGVSHRLRSAVGKGYLTDERLIADTCRFFDSVEGDGKGRAAWHVMAGLPGQKPLEELALREVIQEIDRRQRGHTARNLSIHVQPFQPLPGTPMQWCAAGGDARRLLATFADLGRLAWCRTRCVGGRTNDVALVCTSLSRADERGADLLEASAERKLTPREAAEISGSTFGELDLDAPLPWDFVRQWQPKETLRRAHEVMRKRLAEA